MKSDFEKRLGVEFQDKDLLKRALTHSSYAMEQGLDRTHCNERLEFLGDAFFDAIIGEALYERLETEEEGKLTRLRALIVCEKSLYEEGQALGIGQELWLGHGEETTGGRCRPSIVADAMEAVMGALYLDQGYQVVRQVVLRLFAQRMEEAIQGRIITDYKSSFQELCQRQGAVKIEYRLVGEEGPDHNKRFFTQVWVEGKAVGHGEGRNKKEAEQAAAKNALGL